jgi:hypothetical protein
MRDNRLLFLIVLGVGAYALAAYMILSQDAPISLPDLYAQLKERFTEIYFSIFGL